MTYWSFNPELTVSPEFIKIYFASIINICPGFQVFGKKEIPSALALIDELQ